MIAPNIRKTDKFKNPKVKDFSYLKYQDVDDKDFQVKTIEDERLIDSVPGLDAAFDEDMYNFGDMDDLPDSDREMQCRSKKIGYNECFNK